MMILNVLIAHCIDVRLLLLLNLHVSVNMMADITMILKHKIFKLNGNWVTVACLNFQNVFSAGSSTMRSFRHLN